MSYQVSSNSVSGCRKKNENVSVNQRSWWSSWFSDLSEKKHKTWKRILSQAFVQCEMVGCIHVKLEKFKREISLSLCILEKREILHETILRHLFGPFTFKCWLKFLKWRYIPSYQWFFIWRKNIVFLYLVDTLLTKQCICMGKFNTISPF